MDVSGITTQGAVVEQRPRVTQDAYRDIGGRTTQDAYRDIGGRTTQEQLSSSCRVASVIEFLL